MLVILLCVRGIDVGYAFVIRGIDVGHIFVC